MLQKKDYARALLEFKNATVAMPKDAEPYYQTGIAFLESGNFQNGIIALRKATELNPQHQQAQLKLAELMASSTNKEVLEQAAKRLETVLAASPDNSAANDVLALTEWKLGKTEEAINRLENTLHKFPSRLQTSVALARLKLSQKDLPAAERLLQQAVASAPQSAAAELALGQFYMLANDPAKAEAELRKSIQLDSKNGAALMGLATIQVAGQRLEEAEQTYRQLASLPDPAYKPVHALFLYRLGKKDEALAELEKIFQANPADRRARSRLYAAYRAMGKTQAAQNLLETALKKNPKDTDALYERALLSQEAGKTTEAERDIKAVLHFKPDSPEAHVAMAAIYKAQHLTRSERQELNEALRINPSLLPARLMLARNFTLANEPRSALGLLDNAPPAQKTSPALIAERNWALLAAGELQQARAALNQIPQRDRYPELVVQDAVFRFQQGDYAGALTNAEEALKNNPADIRAPRLIADIYLAQKQPAKAEERLKAIVSAQPQSAPLANLMGQFYLRTNNLSAARKAFEAATNADRNFAPAILALAQLDNQDKHPEAAYQRLQGLLAASPNDVTALLLMGAIAGEMGNQEEAVNRYRAVIAIDSSNVMALNNLAYTLALTRTDEALGFARQAVELAPDNAAVQDTLGWIYYRKANYDLATTYLQTAVAKEPTPRRQFHLAMSYIKSGKRDLGQTTLLRALQQDPNLQQSEKGW